MSFIFPYADTQKTQPQKFTHAWFEDGTMTLGDNRTNWITSDTVMEVRR